MNKKIIYCFALFFSVTSCSKTGIQHRNDALLFGSWQWERTAGGLAGHIHDTPQSTGQTIELKLSENKRYTITTNGIVSSEGTYWLSTKKCIHDCSDKTFIDFSADPDQMVELSSGNQLLLSDEATDGLMSHYKRQRLSE
jgi:hypothetical protein